jgi:hypothetical protein
VAPRVAIDCDQSPWDTRRRRRPGGDVALNDFHPRSRSNLIPLLSRSANLGHPPYAYMSSKSPRILMCISACRPANLNAGNSPEMVFLGELVCQSGSSCCRFCSCHISSITQCRSMRLLWLDSYCAWSDAADYVCIAQGDDREVSSA